MIILVDNFTELDQGRIRGGGEERAEVQGVMPLRGLKKLRKNLKKYFI